VLAVQSGIDWATMWNSTGTHVTTMRRRMQMGLVPERSAVNGTLSQVTRNEAQVVVDVDKRSKVTAAAGMSASRCRPVSRHSFVTVSNLQDFSDTDSSCGVAVGPVLEDTYRSRRDADEIADAVESHRRRAFAARGSCCNSLRVNDDGRRLSPARLIGDDVHLARHTEQQREDGHRVGGKMEPESTMGSGWRAGDRSARLQEDRGLPENRHWQRRPEFNGGDRPASDINSGDEDRRSHDNGRRRDARGVTVRRGRTWIQPEAIVINDQLVQVVTLRQAAVTVTMVVLDVIVVIGRRTDTRGDILGRSDGVRNLILHSTLMILTPMVIRAARPIAGDG
jgi:hypothetical protein